MSTTPNTIQNQEDFSTWQPEERQAFRNVLNTRLQSGKYNGEQIGKAAKLMNDLAQVDQSDSNFKNESLPITNFARDTAIKVLAPKVKMPGEKEGFFGKLGTAFMHGPSAEDMPVVDGKKATLPNENEPWYDPSKYVNLGTSGTGFSLLGAGITAVQQGLPYALKKLGVEYNPDLLQAGEAIGGLGLFGVGKNEGKLNTEAAPKTEVPEPIVQNPEVIQKPTEQLTGVTTTQNQKQLTSGPPQLQAGETERANPTIRGEGFIAQELPQEITQKINELRLRQRFGEQYDNPIRGVISSDTPAIESRPTQDQVVNEPTQNELQVYKPNELKASNKETIIEPGSAQSEALFKGKNLQESLAPEIRNPESSIINPNEVVGNRQRLRVPGGRTGLIKDLWNRGAQNEEATQVTNSEASKEAPLIQTPQTPQNSTQETLQDSIQALREKMSGRQPSQNEVEVNNPEEKTVKLYRAETSGKGLLPNWLKENPEYQDYLKNINGRWYTNSLENLEFYKKDSGDNPVIKSIEVPESVWNEAKTNKEAQRYSLRAGKENDEGFLPQEYAQKAQEIKVTNPEPQPKVVLPDSLRPYQQALEQMEPNNLSHIKNVARLGLGQKLKMQQIVDDLISNGVNEKSAAQAVLSSKFGVNRQKGAVGANLSDPELERFKEKYKNTPEEGPSTLGKISNFVRSQLESTGRFLGENEKTAPISNIVLSNYDNERSWIGNTKNLLANQTGLKDLSSEEMANTRDVLRDEAEPINNKVKAASEKVKAIQENIHQELLKDQEKYGIGFKSSGESIGHLDNYLHDMERMTPQGSLFDGIREYMTGKGSFLDHFGKAFGDWKGAGKDDQSIYGKEDVNTPKAGMAEERTGKLLNKEQDLNTILGHYVETAGRLKFRKPAILALQEHLNDLPEGALKNSSMKYVRNYATANENADTGWDAITGPLMRQNSRTLMLMNPRLWLLHLGRLRGVYQQLGNADTYSGIKETFSDLPKEFQRAKNDGLIPGYEIGPKLFASTGQKITKAMGAFQIADAIPDMIARNGFEKKFTQEHPNWSPATIKIKSLTAAKNSGLRIDPVRQSELFSRWVQGPIKPYGQYRQTHFKIAEDYLRDSIGIIKNYSKGNTQEATNALGRMILSTGLAYGITKSAGVTLYHFRGSAFDPTKLQAPSIDMPVTIAKKLLSSKEKDFNEGVARFIAYIIPGGTSVRSQIKEGKPSFFETDPGTKLGKNLRGMNVKMPNAVPYVSMP